MKNSTINLANSLLGAIDPELAKDVSKSISTHIAGGVTYRALTGLLQLLSEKKPMKTKEIKYRKVWDDILAKIWDNSGVDSRTPVHRSKICNIKNNDYTKMQHWGLIKPVHNKKGFWKVTDIGTAYLAGKIKIPEKVVRCKDGCSKWHFNKDIKLISCGVYRISAECIWESLLSKMPAGSPNFEVSEKTWKHPEFLLKVIDQNIATAEVK